jgi:hypothetical protein
MTLVLFITADLVFLVVAGNVYDSITAFFYCAFLQGKESRQHYPATGFFIAFVESVGASSEA